MSPLGRYFVWIAKSKAQGTQPFGGNHQTHCTLAEYSILGIPILIFSITSTKWKISTNNTTKQQKRQIFKNCSIMDSDIIVMDMEFYNICGMCLSLPFFGLRKRFFVFCRCGVYKLCWIWWLNMECGLDMDVR